MRRWWKRSTLNAYLQALQAAVSAKDAPDRILYLCRYILSADPDETLLPRATRAAVLEALGNSLVESAEERSGAQAVARFDEALVIQDQLFALIDEDNALAFAGILMQRSVAFRSLGDRRSDEERW